MQVCSAYVALSTSKIWCHASISNEVLQVDSCLESQPLAEVPYIKAFWDVLTEQHREELLTVDYQQLWQTALELIEAVNTHPCKPMCINAAPSPLLMC